jgi:hypothetical protein
MNPRVRFCGFLLLFVLLTWWGFSWVAEKSGMRASDFSVLAGMSWGEIGFLIVMFWGVYLTDVVRYRVMGQAMGVEIPWKAGIDATVASLFISWLTPASIGGAPAAIFMLGRRGIPWDAAAVIAFGKGIFGTALLVLFSFTAIFLGLGPDLPEAFQAPLVWGSLVMIVSALMMLLAGLFPGVARTVLEGSARPLRALGRACHPKVAAAVDWCHGLGEGGITRLARFSHGGIRGFAAIIAANVAYLTCFVAVAVTLAHFFGAVGLVKTGGISLVYLAFTYVAPTPGGAGLAEAGAVPFFGGVLPAREAAMTVILFRLLTFYLQILVGFVYLLFLGEFWHMLEAAPPADSALSPTDEEKTSDPLPDPSSAKLHASLSDPSSAKPDDQRLAQPSDPRHELPPESSLRRPNDPLAKLSSDLPDDLPPKHSEPLEVPHQP